MYLVELDPALLDPLLLSVELLFKLSCTGVLLSVFGKFLTLMLCLLDFSLKVLLMDDVLRPFLGDQILIVQETLTFLDELTRHALHQLHVLFPLEEDREVAVSLQRFQLIWSQFKVFEFLQ